MKVSIRLFMTIPVISGAILLSCNSGTDNTASEPAIHYDSSATVKKDSVAGKPDTTQTTTATTTSTATTTTTTVPTPSEKKTITPAVPADKGKSVPAPGTKKTKVISILKTSNDNKDNKTSNSTEVIPQFPGGQKALDKFIADNVVYPEAAVEHGVEGTVMVDFEIDKMGMIYTPRVTSTKMGYGLETEAMKVINKMPLWVPARINGKNIKTHYSLPITFQINQ